MGSVSRALLLAALAALATVGCTDEKVPPPADAGADAKPAGDGGAGDGSSDTPASGEQPVDCFKGTPRTHEELLNQCWPETVASFPKTPNLPGGYQVGQPLPPPP
jgi:hypothetical protein